MSLRMEHTSSLSEHTLHIFPIIYWDTTFRVRFRLHHLTDSLCRTISYLQEVVYLEEEYRWRQHGAMRYTCINGQYIRDGAIQRNFQ